MSTTLPSIYPNPCVRQFARVTNRRKSARASERSRAVRIRTLSYIFTHMCRLKYRRLAWRNISIYFLPKTGGTYYFEFRTLEWCALKNTFWWLCPSIREQCTLSGEPFTSLLNIFLEILSRVVPSGFDVWLKSSQHQRYWYLCTLRALSQGGWVSEDCDKYFEQSGQRRAAGDEDHDNFHERVTSVSPVINSKSRARMHDRQEVGWHS